MKMKRWMKRTMVGVGTAALTAGMFAHCADAQGF
jgi:hypothetical protein